MLLAGVVGEPNDVGEAEWEKLGEGVSGALGSADQGALESVEVGANFVDGDELWVMPRVGVGFTTVNSSLMASEASVQAARLEINTVG